MEEYLARIRELEGRLAAGQRLEKSEQILLLLGWLVMSRTRRDRKYDLP